MDIYLFTLMSVTYVKQQTCKSELDSFMDDMNDFSE